MAAKLLIIGGTRFLGITIAEAFIKKGGYELHIMNRGTKQMPECAIGQIMCDKSDRAEFAKVLKRGWDIVIDTILNDEDLRFVVETIGSDVGHFIHTGSIGVYGAAQRIPALESDPLCECHDDAGMDIVFDYKIRQDKVLLQAFQEKRFPCTIMRESYICGPGDIPLDGWGGRNIEFFKMLRDKKKIFLPTDGRALLHPGDVRDLGRAFLHAAARPGISIGQVYNVCGDHALMMRDYVRLLAEIMGVKADLEFVPFGEVVSKYGSLINEFGMRFAGQHMCASIEKIVRDLDWHPEIPLKVGLRENIEWMKVKKLL